MSLTKPTARTDVYRAVTDSIVAAIEAGAGTFVMPWHGRGAAIAKPENAWTRVDYHGVNVLALWAAAYAHGYGSGYWASYKQWQLAGAQVKQGECGTTVVFFKRIDTWQNETAAECEPSHTRLVARASRVFNSEQVAGWAPPPPRTFGSRVEVLASVETFTRATKATITHGGDIACYDVVRDVIKMPVPERFTGSPTSTPSQAYQAVLLHELVHWSGAKHRLDRKLTGLSLTDRAREELVAELGAAFLCADLGIANDPRPDHAAYVDSWLAVLKRDTRAVFTAARQAGAAANFLHDLAAGGS